MKLLASCALLGLSILATSCASVGSRASAPAESVDVAILNGTVIDGSGSKGRVADVLVSGDRIVAIGDFDDAQLKAAKVVDAHGLTVTPGFIDTHSHGDPVEKPAMENFLAQGVTTVCLGMDGESPAQGSLASWMEKVRAANPGPNVAAFVGHGTVREESGTNFDPVPSKEHLAKMVGLVDQAMSDGAFGMTTGLEYLPGSYSKVEELIALAEPVGRQGGLVMSHMRSEDNDTIDGAIDELVAQGIGGKCPVHISHFKVVYGPGASRADELLAKLDAARAKGATITADVYPYTASYTGIAIVFPIWAQPPFDYAQVKRERREELAAYIRKRVTLRNGPEATLFGTEPYTGMTLAEVAKKLGMPYEDVLIDRIGPLGASGAYFVMNEDLQARIVAAPNVNICSDGSPTMNHPRGYGSFPRIVRKFVLEDKAMTLEAAVNKMTGLSAQTIGLDRQQRGLLREGFAADILVFDPAAVRDTATFDKPHQLATGFDTILVNGRVVREKGVFAGTRAGAVLRRQLPPLGPASSK